ncbi:MAG: TonB-dependent receptor [Bacteroidia bacterium]|nr:TonB-dependent receptor [Bacteroidia bacterium]
MKKKLIKGISPDREIVRKIWMTMRLIVLLFFVSLMHVSASVYSQKTRLNIKVENATLQQVFKALQEQSEFDFFYKNEQIPADARVSVEFQNESVEVILNQILNGTGLTYHVLDKDIVISSKGIADNENSQQQQNVVKGKVTDQSGAALPGASVMVKGTTNGAVTSIEGIYTLANVPANGTIVFSFVGMKTEEIQVGGKTVVNMILTEETIGLEDIVVIGYGTAKKSDVTGALASVSEKTIKEKPVQNALQAMQGKAAGVDIVSNVRPGEVSSISIRGTRSINGSNSPLFVVDGIIMMGTINDINPNDIASIEILKDASSTAIYGSRGANGVILITTKAGKKGKIAVNYEASLAIDQIHSLTKWASAGEAIDRYRLADIDGATYKAGSVAFNYPDPTADIQTFGNSDVSTINAIRSGYEWNDPGTYASVKTRAATTDEIAKGWPAQVPVYNPGNIPSTDWIGLLTQPSSTQNHLLSISAGNDISKVYISAGYLDNNGTQKNQSYRRYTFRLNGDITPTKWMNVGASINASRSIQNYGTINRAGSATGPKDAYGTALSEYPMATPYDANGVLIEKPGGNNTIPVWNPLIDIDNAKDERMATNLNANLYAEIKFLPWIRYRMNFGTGIRNYRNATWQGSQSTLLRTATPPTSTASYASGETFQYMLENLLYIDKTINVHTFGLTLLQSAQYLRSESSNIGASKILYNSSLWYNLGANLNGKPDGYGTGFGESSLQSYMGRFNYSLKNKYLLTITGRWDGSSVLAEGHKWDFFPSFAAAWKIQEENFLKPIGWINELKLRLGYGVTGNSGVGSYTTMGPLTQYNYVFGTAPAIGYIPMSMANPGLSWEKTAQMNTGIDFSILNRRISGSVEFYQSNTSDILMQRDIPVITGYPNIWFNIGKMRNTGVEITLSTVNIQKHGLRWTTDLTFSANKERIVELVNGKEDMKANNYFIGQPLQVFRTYVVDGLWQNTTDDLAEIAKWAANGFFFEPGQYKPVEQGTPDYKLTDADMVIRGSDRPKWVAGMNNTISYKNFELSFFVYSRIGQSYFSSLQPGGSAGGQYVGYVRSANPNEFWSADNPNARWPKPTSKAKTSVAAVNQAMYINDGSFVTVRNIGLSYSVPSRLLEKYQVKSCQIYTQVLNPFIFGGDAVKAGLNPDDTNGWTSVNSVGDPTGGNNNNTMMIRSLVFGLRVGF